MKIKIVFNPVHINQSMARKLGLSIAPRFLLAGVVDDSGAFIDTDTVGEWIADGDVEALVLDVLPPLDKVTLTVVEATGKPLAEPLPAPEPGAIWQHYSGRMYRVLFLTNMHSDGIKYRPEVVYEGVDNFRRWSGRLDDWHRRMTLKFAPDGTMMNADGTRSIFDDVDK